MANNALSERYLAEFPFWRSLTTAERESVAASAFIKNFAKEQIISGNNLSCMGVVYVIEGSIRISLVSDDGREITLYTVYSGDRCVAAAPGSISRITFERVVSAAEDTRLLVIPSELCSDLSKRNVHVREFIFETETKRYSQSIHVIQRMLFKRFDQRLAFYLIERYEEKGSAELRITHKEIARDINSAREVVARMLGRFAAGGLVELKRGCIVLTDIHGIKKLL